MAIKRKLQVFVSSTYRDLKAERQTAVQAILSAGHIPAGMELFAAGDESQLKVIRRWIDESDLYMLILGTRYGSIDQKSGKSYTELEYEHAVSVGKPLFACVIDESAVDARIKAMGKDAIDDHGIKLKAFRAEVLSRMSGFWSDSKDIALTIHQSLGEYESQDTLTGWVRADGAIDPVAAGRLAEEIARLSSENQELREALSNTVTEPARTPDDLAGLDEEFELRGNFKSSASGTTKTYDWSETTTWREMFTLIGPYLRENPHENIVSGELARAFAQKNHPRAHGAKIDDQIFQTISLQFTALGLAKQNHLRTTAGGRAMYWSLTPKGEELMFQSRIVRTQPTGGNGSGTPH